MPTLRFETALSLAFQTMFVVRERLTVKRLAAAADATAVGQCCLLLPLPVVTFAAFIFGAQNWANQLVRRRRRCLAGSTSFQCDRQLSCRAHDLPIDTTYLWQKHLSVHLEPNAIECENEYNALSSNYSNRISLTNPDRSMFLSACYPLPSHQNFQTVSNAAESIDHPDKLNISHPFRRTPFCRSQFTYTVSTVERIEDAPGQFRHD